MNCTARRKDGSPCRVQARPGRSFCAFHDPELQAQRAEGQRAGGRHKRTTHRLDRLTPETLRPVLDRLLGAMDGLEAGTVEPKIATAMAAVASSIVRVYELAGLEAELLAAQQRLDALQREHLA